MTESTVDRVRSVISAVFGVPLARVTAKSTRDDLQPQWDSGGIVNLIMGLEAEFGVTFTIDEAADLLSVELIMAVLREKGAA